MDESKEIEKSEVIEPTRIYDPDELIDYRQMEKSPLRDQLKTEMFRKLYTPKS